MRFTNARWNAMIVDGLSTMAERSRREGAHQACAEARNDSVERPKVRRSHPRPIKNQQLMFEQQRLGDNGTSAATAEESGDRGDEMNKQHDQVAHRGIVAIGTNVTRLGYPQDLCDKSEIRHRHART